MTKEIPDLAALVTQLEQRLAKVEGRNRWAKRAGAAAFLLGGAVLLLGQFPTGQAEPAKGTIVKAKEFVLRDAKGKMRGRFFLNGDSVLLSLCGENEQTSVVLDESGLTLFDEKGKTKALLRVVKGRSGLTLVGESKAQLRLSAAAEPSLELVNQEGKTAFTKP